MLIGVLGCVRLCARCEEGQANQQNKPGFSVAMCQQHGEEQNRELLQDIQAK